MLEIINEQGRIANIEYNKRLIKRRKQQKLQSTLLTIGLTLEVILYAIIIFSL